MQLILTFFGIFCHKSFKPIKAIQLYLAEGVWESDVSGKCFESHKWQQRYQAMINHDIMYHD